MKSLSKVKEDAITSYRTDANYNRVKRWSGPTARRLPSATVEYVSDKFPVAHWLPHYDYRWIVQDIIAGITIGVMFIPQGLSYAKIATISIEHGLYSSWIPSALYFFLGTSKELSTGPTSILGLLTSEAVAEISKEGYTPEAIASAMAFLVGVFALCIGMLKLGFLLDFVSATVLSGWISAVALVILLGQVGSLTGLDTGRETAEIIRDVLGHLDKIQGLTICVGLTGILMLWLLEQVGKRWGKKNKWIKLVSSSRAVVVLFIYTLISWGVNKDRDEENYLWAVTEVDTNGLLPPKNHDNKLISRVAGRCAAPLIAMSVEHLGVGKAFGLRNNYQIDKSQELVFLGANNMVNSLFGAMLTGGAMSRTAVNSESGVRSPVNFLFTAGFVLLTLYELAPALYWIPKATLSAIIIMAVANLISPPRLFYRYWRMSFIDFVASMLGFWVTLFTSTEIGLAVAVGFSIVYTLLRLAFPQWVGQTSKDDEDTSNYAFPKHRSVSDTLEVPADAFLVRYTEDILFPNAERVKSSIIDSVKMHYEPPQNMIQDNKSVDRSWSVSGRKRILKMRKRKGVTPITPEMSPLRHVVLDFSMVGFIDVTGVLSLIELKMELRRYMGKELQFRFINMHARVTERFQRSEWEFARQGEERSEEADVIYPSLETALLHRDGDDKHELVQEKTLEV